MSEQAAIAPTVVVGNRKLGLGYRSYIVAEMSANHGCDFPIAARTLIAAKAAGVDAIKVQAYTADTMTFKSKDPRFQAGGIWTGHHLYDLYAKAAMPWDWIRRLQDMADGSGIELFSTVYDQSSVDFLEREIDPPLYKVASFELTDIPLLKYVAQTGKPVVLSTGMASIAEIDEALRTLIQHGAGGVILLYCVSQYPCSVEAVNLSTMNDMMHRFDVPVGFSDHTQGICAGIAAATLQACMIEKHFTLPNVDSPDTSFSADQSTMSALVKSVRLAQDSVGSVVYDDPGQVEMKQYRRSLYVVRAMRTGQRFKKSDIGVFRPDIGLKPREYDRVLNSVAAADIPAGTPLVESLVANGRIAAEPAKPSRKRSKKSKKAKKGKRK